MERRTLIGLGLGAAALADPAVARSAIAGTGADSNEAAVEAGGLDAAFARFLNLPGKKSYLLHVGPGGNSGRFSHRPQLFLFTASAFKTFVLAQYLRDVESGRLSEGQPIGVDDSVRSPGSPVLLHLTGEAPAVSILEAMISHSDNTATDAAMRKVGADRVRALIASAGLSTIRIPDSTRIFTSYIFGAPPGVDLGWARIVELMKHPPERLRPLLNRVMTLAGTARDFVSWYEQALAGRFFSSPQPLKEFQRIQAMSVQIARTAPPNTVAYAKGGEVADFDGFNAKSFAGQIILANDLPITFCFIVNWQGPRQEFPKVETEFFASIGTILRVLKRNLQT